MIRYLSVAAMIAVGATVVYAQGAGGDAAIKDRKAAMKAIGGATKAPSAMVKGEAPFDLVVVKASLKTIEENAIKAKGQFPDDSKTGDTEALPAIWEKKADFLAKFDKMAADAAAVAGAVKDEASFKEEWKKIGANCGGCHKDYRKPPEKK